MDNIIRFPATYNKDVPQEYLGNPYIEALPDMLDIKSYFEATLFLPSFDKTYRHEPAHIRNVKIVEVYKYLVPNQHYYDLYRTLWRMMFTTYTDRNSFNTEAVREQYSKLLLRQKMNLVWKGTTGESLLITAPSGFGKTMMVKRVLHSLTQVIDHEEYEGRKFKQPQVLWIYLKIPSNAARKSLCHLFLKEVDKCVGTTYSTDTPTSTQIGAYENLFKTIIETYKLGMLVIDEMQNLSVSKSGGDDEFLNFFSELSEQWSMALVLVGTPNIIPILEKTFTATRRLTSGGDKHFSRYAKDDTVWKGLVTTLWSYQYITSPSTIYDDKREIIDHKFFDEIYKLTQGIPFIFSFLFIHAQMIAIESNEEKLSIKQWRKAYNESSQLIKAAIEDIRHNKGKNYPDLMNAAQYQSSPEKTEMITNIKKVFEGNSLTPSVDKILRKEINKFEDKYVLNEKEQSLINTIKHQKLFIDDASNGDFIEGECEVKK
ncbi:ATP-binding protein [Pseudoalteromonas aurantia]|uniref:ORC1/DEAH AAA+ ATPase domain-containing protein n=1 Tax=Pseudoalteromonas aurantia 208 TaxID=1314867 RepID=A0ABR9EF91_9GAMM|nr:ATP-binding protein [Pseudoalteromonas aurantia]MBE0369659.1 hypothetical protein [Pseudoalteromonas aurantia 208]